MEIINQEFAFELPEGFEKLTDAELAKRYSNETPNRIGYLGQEGKTLLVFSWYKSNWILLRLADLKTAIKRNCSYTEAAYKGRDFKFFEFIHETLNGVKLEGYAYSFNSEEGKKNGVTFLFKGPSCLYSANLYTLGDGEISAEEIKKTLSTFHRNK